MSETKPEILTVVPSTSRPGFLSLRTEDGHTLYTALLRGGFQAGDRITFVREVDWDEDDPPNAETAEIAERFLDAMGSKP